MSVSLGGHHLRQVIAAFFALGLSGGAIAQDETVTPEGFAVSNAYGALYHEFGHLFVDQFQLPLLGNEEYAADAIATLLIVRFGGDAAYDISFDTVDGYLRSADIYGAEKLDEVDFNSEHGMDQQRAAQMTCLLVGANPADFTDLANQMGMEAERQEACAGEFDQARSGWERLVADHVRGTGPEGAPLTITYEDAGSYEPMARLLRDNNVLETVASVITTEFRLVAPATMRAALCGEENAFYDPADGSVTLCYEYVQLYFDMVADPANAGLDTSG
jgi:hypothetical protein